MGSKPTLSHAQKSAIRVHIIEGKFTLRQIAKFEKVALSTIIKIKKMLRDGEDIFATRHHISGSKRKTTPRTDKKIVSLVHKNVSITKKTIREELQIRGVDISERTVQRRLVEAGLSARPRKKPLLTSEATSDPLNLKIKKAEKNANTAQHEKNDNTPVPVS